MVLSIVIVLPEFTKSPRVQWSLVGLSVVAYMALGAPAMARHVYTQDYLPGLEVAWRCEFMEHEKARDYLVIDNDCTLWVTHKVSCTFQSRINERPDLMQFHLRNHTFSAIYVFQRLDIDPATGAATVRKGDELAPCYELETVREERLRTFSLARLSRVVAIRSGDKVEREGNVKEQAPKTLDAKTVEELRLQYLQNYLIKLP
jgi:hypothetical protein